MQVPPEGETLALIRRGSMAVRQNLIGVPEKMLTVASVSQNKSVGQR